MSGKSEAVGLLVTLIAETRALAKECGVALTGDLHVDGDGERPDGFEGWGLVNRFDTNYRGETWTCVSYEAPDNPGIALIVHGPRRKTESVAAVFSPAAGSLGGN